MQEIDKLLLFIIERIVFFLNPHSFN